ncbi:MarR family winged helix-turn-helix transcriptional regulator [Subtercola sp. RTI3]|uniref:MarR family winged helix-turn-helix transcriptional regulator n=1 Tax=Subtercola sp. RTI3 TaxID=3048639 RepID=UPI002B233E57|nr:MarR family transcriptional regulator [Subtercola sp. RTI3]MEA9985570.1 MarR family transcriptional regulator [Subtercola sp. RTI3]
MPESADETIDRTAAVRAQGETVPASTPAVGSPESMLMPDVNRDDVAERLTLVISRLSRRIRPVGDELSHGVLSALSSVKTAGPLRPSDLARLENVAAPTMTRIVADLENRGLIERTADPLDGRSFLLRATPAGVGAVAQARSSRTARVLTMLAEQSDADLASLARALPVLETVAAGRL